MRSAFVGIDPVYEEAAICLGESKLRTFLKITLPLAKTGVTGAFLITFGMGVSVFDIPYIMAGPYNRWLSSKIWQEMFFFMNWPFAAAVAVVLVLIAIVILLLMFKTKAVAV
jgi:putrescine transport system permease protein